MAGQAGSRALGLPSAMRSLQRRSAQPEPGGDRPRFPIRIFPRWRVITTLVERSSTL
jgi:hypothetical protein